MYVICVQVQELLPSGSEAFLDTQKEGNKTVQQQQQTAKQSFLFTRVDRPHTAQIIP